MDEIRLLGTEEVRSASNRMSDAADRMSRAAGEFSDAVRRLEVALDEFDRNGASLVHRLEELNRGRNEPGE